MQLSLRFYGSLNDFLLPRQQQQAFAYYLTMPATVKAVVEAVGVPHPEVDLILVNGESVNFDHWVKAGDYVSVYPQFYAIDTAAVSAVRPHAPAQVRFVVDVHLGKLATYLRLLGLDTLYQNNWDDPLLAQLAHAQQRWLLTQDRGLLKRSLVVYGYCVRSHVPQQQLKEIVERFNLRAQIAPLQRCPRCNGEITQVETGQIAERLPAQTQLEYDQFFQCLSCWKIYWKGAHYQRIQQLIQSI